MGNQKHKKVTAPEPAARRPKVITPSLPGELGEWLEDEAIRRSRAEGRRVSQNAIVVEALERARASAS